jgi:hypothetical protein
VPTDLAAQLQHFVLERSALSKTGFGQANSMLGQAWSSFREAISKSYSLKLK